MKRKLLLTGIGSSIWFLYCAGFAVWFVPHVRRMQLALESQNFQEAAALRPSVTFLILHGVATLCAAALLIYLVADAAQQKGLSKPERGLWLLFLVALAPLSMPTYVWCVLRHEHPR